MGAVEHLKTVCCLGLKPESAMIAVVPVLHEIIPHGWTKANLFAPDGTIGNGYAENPEAAALYRERLWTFMDDPSSPVSLFLGRARARSGSAGHCIDKAGVIWKAAIIGKSRLRSIPVGFWTR
jgi:hypothetical protein